MAFTYLDSLATNRDKVRFHINDKTKDEGPHPNNANFSDAEITFILSEEDDRVNGGVAFAFELLANAWASYAVSEKEDDTSFDGKEVKAKYDALAAEWRKKPGGAALANQSSAFVTLTRVDEYSD